MKKLVLIAAVGAAIFSCKKDGETTDGSIEGSSDRKDVVLTEEEKLGSYAYGVSLGRGVDNYNQNPDLDSLDIDEVNRGVKEFLDDPEELASYTFGLNIGQQIQGAINNKVIDGHLDKDEVIAGLMDYVNKRDLKVSKDSIQIVMDNFYQSRLKSSADINKKRGIQFMNDIKQEAGVKTTESGIAYKVIKEGNGESPNLGDRVKVKYTGTTIDGKVFDSTDKNNDGEAIEFPLNPGGLIPGWIEAIQLMSKGSEYKIFIPSELAYGERGSGAIGQNETLIFDIELVDFTKGELPQPSSAPQPPQTQPGVKIQTK